MVRYRFSQIGSHSPQLFHQYLICDDHRTLKHKFSFSTGGRKDKRVLRLVYKGGSLSFNLFSPGLIPINSEQGTRNSELVQTTAEAFRSCEVQIELKLENKSDEHQKEV